MNPFTPPSGYSRIQVVASYDALVSTPLADGVNALCWPRTLPGDFGEVVAQLQVSEGINTIDGARLRTLNLSEAGRAARDILLVDQKRLRDFDLDPALDCIDGYTHELDTDIVPTHVQSYHVDSATAPADTILCTYLGPSSDGLRNEEAVRRVDIPETRAQLLHQYGGQDDNDFLEFLNERFYDLHYLPLPGAEPFSFGIGNLWRIACAYPGSPVPPCIHRAPATIADAPPRLLLIS